MCIWTTNSIAVIPLIGVDYVKLDGCYSEPSTMDAGYPEFGMYLNKTKRPMVYSCSWPAYQIGLGKVRDVQPFFITVFQVKILTISRLQSTATFGETLMIFTTRGILSSGSSITTARTRTGSVSSQVPGTGMILTCWLLVITGCHLTRPGLRWECGQCLQGTNIKWQEQNSCM